MQGSKGKTLRTGSLISLIAALITVLLQIAGYYQTKFQLTSPLIPKNIINQIATPHLQIAGIASIVFLVALIFHLYSKYIVTMILCILVILFPQFYIEVITK